MTATAIRFLLSICDADDKEISETILACIVLGASLAIAHQPGSYQTGTEAPDVPSVESCSTFTWTKKTECRTYDTTRHHWEVTNNCPRAIKVRWADNAFDRPIRRNEETGKPRAESSTNLKPGKTKKGDVGCVDRAELEMCIEYVYPPLKEHDVNCDGFFD